MNYISKLELDGSTAPIGSSLFGVCETAANEQTKVIDIPEFDRPTQGTTIFVLFKNGNVSDSMNLVVGEYEMEYSVVTRDNFHVPIFNGETVLSFTFDMARPPVLRSPYWRLNEDGFRSIPVVYSPSNSAVKTAYCSQWGVTNASYFIINIRFGNTYQGELQLKINDGTPYTIYINGEISSETNYSLRNGIYIGYFDGTNYYFNTDGSIPNLENYYVKKTGDTMSGNLTVSSGTITAGGHNYSGAGLLRSMNTNGWAQLYAGTSTNEVGLSVAVATDPIPQDQQYPSAQSIIYRKNTAKSPTMIGTYKSGGSFVNYCIGSDAISDRRWQIIPTVDNSGYMNIGKFVRFHATRNDTTAHTFQITNTGNGKLSCSGSVTTNSSRKIKENIEDITISEAKNILNLRPVKFDYINGSTDERGFIAEEVAEIYPNLVVPENEEFDIPASLNYIGIIPYLVKVIQDQEKRLNEQEKRIKELEK